MHKIFIAWLVSILVSWAPPGRKVEHFPDAKETPEETLARYHSIASDALDVAFMEQEAPLFRGPEWSARARTALLLLAISLKESGLRKDVDLGRGKMSKGDNGRSVCLMQLNLGTGTVPVKDPVISQWTAADVLGDRKRCFQAGLHMVRRSFQTCGGPLQDRLAAYASGDCERGRVASGNRIRAYQRALERHPLPFRLQRAPSPRRGAGRRPSRCRAGQDPRDDRSGSGRRGGPPPWRRPGSYRSCRRRGGTALPASAAAPSPRALLRRKGAAERRLRGVPGCWNRKSPWGSMVPASSSGTTSAPNTCSSAAARSAPTSVS